MATELLVAGVQDAFTALMTTELNSLISGNAVLGSTAISNGTNLDLAGEFSFGGGGSITPSGSPYLGLFLYPLNGDGSTYGDTRFGTTAAGPPPSNYSRGFAGLPAAAGTQAGYFAIPGTSIFQLPLPRGTWKPVLYNLSGVTLTSSGNILYWRATNRKIV